MFQVADFNPATQVTADSALHDKISLDLKGWFVAETSVTGPAGEGPDWGELQNFANFLTSPPLLQRDAPAALYGTLFNRATGKRGRPRIMGCRKTPITSDGLTIPEPLLGGKLVATVLRSQIDPEIRLFKLVANLHLNSTRFIRQLRPAYHRRHHLGPFDEIFAVPMPLHEGGETNFTSSENWLPQNPQRETSVPREQGHEQGLIGYIDAVRQRVAYEINRTVETINLTTPGRLTPPSRSSEARLSQVETYWEFFYHEPLRLVESMIGAARRFSGSTEEALFEVNTLGQSITIRVRIRAGVMLRIYAKTNRRVRFEIEHDLKKMSSSPLSRWVTDTAEFRPVFTDLRNEAAETVNRFFNDLGRPSAHPSQVRSPVALLFEIIRATRNEKHAKDLMEILCVNGRYQVEPKDPLRSAVRRLYEWGVLEQSRPRVYSPSPAWAHAVSVLADQGRLDDLLYSPVMANFRQRRRAQLPPP